jgi:hypothetical protein
MFRFVTIIPFEFWFIIAALFVAWIAFDLPGFVVGVLILLLSGAFL